ncbi:MAG: 2-oxoglutarate dehydrogenase E1 component [Calditrichaeota bacterium]|nr:2-oxoglutarate dehydrogenase E1 component [Calditrichota bacterium]
MNFNTPVGNADPAALDALYQQYQQNPEQLDQGWRHFFQGFDLARAVHGDGPPSSSNGNAAGGSSEVMRESRVLNMIGAYRQRGHLFTRTNPVRTRRVYEGQITLEAFGLEESDLGRTFEAGRGIFKRPATLREIIAHMERTYCASIGVEYRYLRDPATFGWLSERMESEANRRDFSQAEQEHVLQLLTRTVLFERFMHRRFVGQKRFSIEGVENVVPALDAVIRKGADLGIREFVIGTAHRGRLNILSNVMGKTFATIFSEFEGKGYEDHDIAGDVKYHMGYSRDVVTPAGHHVHLSLTPNPSHLEAVDPVTIGGTRAKMDFHHEGDNRRIAPILIHGDAAISGQGVVYEVLQMSQLKGYQTGGTIHIVLNNQVGFTTNYLDGRSSTYCTDIAKTTLSPVFHVNGDDVEALIYVMELAVEFRQRFSRDVFIDILGYRKYGHNESDEPRFTQPVLYKAIARHPDPLEIYRTRLLAEERLNPELPTRLEESFTAELEQALEQARQRETTPMASTLDGDWQGLRRATPRDFQESPITGVKLERLRELGIRISTLHEAPRFFNKIRRIYQERLEMVRDHSRVDWAMGELLAYASLLDEGRPVRLTGQDVERGTFSHRHAVLKVDDSEEEFRPLVHIGDHQGQFRIFNSSLSEYGVLGFEYGYSTAAPQGLTIWEAQFGDFANTAQVIFDQFLSCAEGKWLRMSGLVLLLPHGYEGQGADHSSARLERMLQLCAEYNLQVANCTTPANFYHLLRRQLHRPFRKPLIVMSPKSLLRHKDCQSPLEDMAEGTRFHEVLDDPTTTPEKVTRVLLCSGKLYYELRAKQQEDGREDVAIVRLEQLYPLPEHQLRAVLARYRKAERHVWVQEEPENMGAWSFMLRKFRDHKLEGITRRESSVTATGFHRIHEIEQAEILHQAFV